jgi:cystathionine beta-lyase
VLYDFDRVIDRRCSDSVKWCRYDEDVLPLWVADMDFAAPEPVVYALAERVSHGVFGYGGISDDLREVMQERLAQLYGWHVEPEHITLLPGVVPGFNLACQAVGMPGDGILVEAPGYPPLLRAPENTARSALVVPLVDGGGRYEHDFDALERAITDRTSLFLLCNPHNPVGRVFDRAELERLAEICMRHDLVICSDEIHCDIVFDEHEHIPIASLAAEIADRTITLLAPSKTFNIAGLCCAMAVTPNEELRKALQRAGGDLVHGANLLGQVAASVAYREGQAWLESLLAYLGANRDYLIGFIARHMPHIRCRRPEGTFLAWLDCRGAGISGDPSTFFLEQARVALNRGSDFGPGGDGFVRLNFGCPRAVLADALDRMRSALDAL